MNAYYTVQNRLALKRSNRESLAQIIGEHAEQMCELVKCRSKRELITIGVRIDHLSDEWASLTSRSERPDSEFAITSNRLIHAFSDVMCDYILDKVDPKKLVDIVNLEAKFFGTANASPCLNEWIEYAASIINVADNGAKMESDAFYQLCAECLRRGQVLGRKMK